MTLQGVHHTGLVVRDLDRSIRFYHDLLGLEFYNEPTPWFGGPELEKGVGVPGAELRQVTFWVGEHSTVELLEYRNPAQQATRPVTNNRLGAAHVCFRVEDVWALPTPGGKDDFADLVHRVTGHDLTTQPSPIVRALFAIRWKLGEIFGWDDD